MSNYIFTNNISEVIEKLQSSKHTILKIGHDRCQPCVKIKPVIKDISQHLPEITFVDYDISFMLKRIPTPEEHSFLEDLNFRSVPHFVLYTQNKKLNIQSSKIYSLIASKITAGLRNLITDNPS